MGKRFLKNGILELKLTLKRAADKPAVGFKRQEFAQEVQRLRFDVGDVAKRRRFGVDNFFNQGGNPLGVFVKTIDVIHDFLFKHLGMWIIRALGIIKIFCVAGVFVKDFGVVCPGLDEKYVDVEKF